MYRQVGRLSGICFILLSSLASGGESKFNRVLAVGDDGPAWGSLVGVDGKMSALKDFQKAKVVVLVFTCNHCPVARQYENRLRNLAQKYEKLDVQVVAISVSLHAADGLEAMKKRATEQKLTWPWLHDPSQASAKAYGATATPQFFVLDSRRKVAYMGAFDNDLIADDATAHYVDDAVAALLAGNTPSVKESLQRGCPIDYDE